jgi:hypothetical protein
MDIIRILFSIFISLSLLLLLFIEVGKNSDNNNFLD